MESAVTPSTSCESYLAFNEYRAWQSANAYLKAIDLPHLPIRLNRLVDTLILPALKKIGFNELLAKAMFRIAMPAWKEIGDVSERVRIFDPEAQSLVMEVEQGLRHQARKTYEIYFRPSTTSSQDYFDMVAQRMHPRNLFDLLDDVSTPWIILPRAFRSLKRKHCYYLPLYLDMLMRSNNELCLDKWIRISIEFIANYAIKFAEENLSKETIVNFVVSGYEAMFWKALRSPPAGYEDNRIFEHYLSWMSHSGLLANSDCEMVRESIDRMGSGISRVFPNGNAFHNNIETSEEISCFKIALRHGCLGIVAMGKYFWIGSMLSPGISGKISNYTPALSKMRHLFNGIEKDYPTETRRTRYFIRDFLHQFEAAYKGIRFPIRNMDEVRNSGLQLLVAQILQMTGNLKRSAMGP